MKHAILVPAEVKVSVWKHGPKVSRVHGNWRLGNNTCSSCYSEYYNLQVFPELSKEVLIICTWTRQWGSVLTCWYSFFPKVALCAARSHIISKADSAVPIDLMQWCIRPGPSRPWAISNPLPSPGRGREVGNKCSDWTHFNTSRGYWRKLIFRLQILSKGLFTDESGYRIDL